MTALRIDGKQIAEQIRGQLSEQIKHLANHGVIPGLTVVLVGEDPASQVYVRNKHLACEKLGIKSEVIRMPESTRQEDLLAVVNRLNQDPEVHGILVQLPLPKHISEEAVIMAIDPSKDVDGFHPVSVGNLWIGKDGFVSCTPAGIIELLKHTGIEIAGKHAVVIGRSNIVGKPVAALLLREHATVTVCHSRTVNMKQITSQADILIVAIGRPDFVTGEYIKPGAVVIDVGMNRKADGKLTGDVDYEQAADLASAITPVPGGVGPMTITMLLVNTVQSAKRTIKG